MSAGPEAFLASMQVALHRGSAGLLLAGSVMRDIAGGAILLMAFLIPFDVVARNVFGFSIGGVTELNGYLLAVAITWGLASALNSGTHIRVDVLVMKIPPVWRQHLHLVSITALALFVFVLMRRSWDVVATSWDFGSVDQTTLRIPLVIPQGLWAVGFSVFFATLLLATLRSIAFILAGDAQGVDDLLRSRGLADGDDDHSEEPRAESSGGTDRGAGPW